MNFKERTKERTYLWYIALLRIYIGYYMLQQGIRKFQRDFPRGDWIGRQIGDLATIDLYPWYKKFLVDTVVPHQELFGYLVMYGEILSGGLFAPRFLDALERFRRSVHDDQLLSWAGHGPGRRDDGPTTNVHRLTDHFSALQSRPRAGIGRAYFSRRQRCKMKLQGSATAEGTERYRKRFEGKIPSGHFRQSQGLWLSSIGIGTYLGNHDAETDKLYHDAIVRAVESGCNVIDTAINYRCQRSERSIGTALKELVSRGFNRDEIVIATKGGFIPYDAVPPSDMRSYFEATFVTPGVAQLADVIAGCHCMTPAIFCTSWIAVCAISTWNVLTSTTFITPKRNSGKSRGRNSATDCCAPLTRWRVL